jgi:hypothetical protein
MVREIVQAISPMTIRYPRPPHFDEIARQVQRIEEAARKQCSHSTRAIIAVAERVSRMFNHRGDADTRITAFSADLASGFRSSSSAQADDPVLTAVENDQPALTTGCPAFAGMTVRAGAGSTENA